MKQKILKICEEKLIFKISAETLYRIVLQRPCPLRPDRTTFCLEKPCSNWWSNSKNRRQSIFLAAEIESPAIAQTWKVESLIGFFFEDFVFSEQFRPILLWQSRKIVPVFWMLCGIVSLWVIFFFRIFFFEKSMLFSNSYQNNKIIPSRNETAFWFLILALNVSLSHIDGYKICVPDLIFTSTSFRPPWTTMTAFANTPSQTGLPPWLPTRHSTYPHRILTNLSWRNRRVMKLNRVNQTSNNSQLLRLLRKSLERSIRAGMIVFLGGFNQKR